MTLLLAMVIVGTVATQGPTVYQRQLVADIYQAVARVRVDIDIANAIIREFQLIRKGRQESG